jgi:hypothetical protein
VAVGLLFALPAFLSCNLDKLLESGKPGGGPGSGEPRLVFSIQPSTATVAERIEPPVEVTALTGEGRADTGFSGDITVELGGSSGAALLGTVTRTASQGVASFSDLSVDREGAGYFLIARAAGFRDGVSNPFSVAASGTGRLSLVSGDNQTGTVGEELDAPLVVRVTDAGGNPVAGVTVSWAVTGGGGSISPGSSTTNGSGEASATRTLGTTAGSQTAAATVSGLSGSPVSFTATAEPGPVAELEFAQQPTDTRAAEVISPAVRVRLRDQYGNLATNYTGSVTMSIAPLTGTPGATLSGTTSRTPSGGVATFDDLSIDLAGLDYRLRAAAAGRSKDSDPFDVTVTSGSASTLSMLGGNNQTGTVGEELDAPLVVRVTDAGGNPVAGVTVSWAVTGGGGSISPGSSTTNGSGEASATRTLGTTAGSQTAAATVSGLSGSPVSFTATAEPGPVAELEFAQQPTDTRAAEVISPAVRVRLRDQYGNLAGNYTGSVTMSIAPLTGTPGATLSGTTSRTPSGGVATFDDLSIDLVGLGYRLRAAAAGRTRDSDPFDVVL